MYVYVCMAPRQPIRQNGPPKNTDWMFYAVPPNFKIKINDYNTSQLHDSFSS